MANIVLRMSGGAANTDPNASLGGAMSEAAGAVISTSNTNLNNLFDNITKSENFSSTTDYRCVFVHNDILTAGEVFAEPSVYLSGSPLATFEVGVVASKNTSAGTIATETDVPAGITFSAPTSGSPLALLSGGDVLDPDDYIAIWIKRTASNITGSGSITDSLNLVVRGVQ